ncbi:hypothetical protein K490DRAFT_56389 [Saccharata proteae CBS 121410]|uniref:Uncharacterized protein n=1 Tax=Saccharata proteae CBS 121410 TaxID=1314787 RepID=A0A9P4HYZ1_9PEZI|nr:hypothetical protein K490DRAFT_56389 [Saccharata proteae CBS 121410]
MAAEWHLASLESELEIGIQGTKMSITRRASRTSGTLVKTSIESADDGRRSPPLHLRTSWLIVRSSPQKQTLARNDINVTAISHTNTCLLQTVQAVAPAMREAARSIYLKNDLRSKPWCRLGKGFQKAWLIIRRPWANPPAADTQTQSKVPDHW